MNVMGGTDLHTPQSIFQPTMSQPINRHPDDAPWMQVPHVPPMTIPWSVPSLQQPDLVTFTGEKSTFPTGPIIHHKRKLDTPPDVVTPVKHFITEEKMAAHFQDLYITPNVNQNATSSLDVNSQNTQFSDNFNCNIQSITEITNDTNKYPRLVLSEEVKNITQESPIPSMLLSKLERPSMALVLWEPPSKHLQNILTEIKPKRELKTLVDNINDNIKKDSEDMEEMIDDTVPNTNNTNLVNDFPSMDLEPMDL